MPSTSSAAPKPSRYVERHFPEKKSNIGKNKARKGRVCYKKDARKETTCWCPNCKVSTMCQQLFQNISITEVEF